MGRRTKLSEAEWVEYAKHYASGVSLHQLSIDSPMSLEGIRKGFLRRGVKLRPPHKTIGPAGRKPKYRD